MTIFKKMFYIFFSLSPIALAGNPSTSECSTKFKENVILKMESCSRTDGVEKSVFKDIANTSPYATAFDTRTVVLLKSDKADNFIEAAGFFKSNKAIFFNKTTLAVIPEEEQISSRKPSKNVTNKGDWIIGYEDIQYAAQGDGAGFPIICATGISKNRKPLIAVSECFPLENKQRFFDALLSITD